MASIYREFIIEAAPDQVWEALRDFGAAHQRLAPGFVLDCRMEGPVRVVTFANGMVAREVLVGMDEAARRLSYAAVGGKATHHNASAQVFPHDGGQTRFVWITDVLPDELAAPIGAMMEQGAAAMKKALRPT